jgi:hypothetical protein
LFPALSADNSFGAVGTLVEQPTKSEFVIDLKTESARPSSDNWRSLERISV